MNILNQKFVKLLLLISMFFFYNLVQAQLVLGTSSSSNKYVSNTPFSYFEISYDGDIEITSDDRAIKSMSAGSYLKISKSSFGNKRKVELRGKSGGVIESRYFEGRTEMPFEPNGAEWLADILLEVIRTTGIGAESRVDRFYKRSGVDGVLNEISEIESNSGKSKYFRALLAKDLKSQEYADLAIAISRTIDSNNKRGELYRDYSDLFLRNDIIAESYFDGISRLSSNTERGSILRYLLRKDLTENQMKGALNVVYSLSSNTEKSSVLRDINQTDIDKMNLTDEYFDAINSMSSNTEISSVLRDLLHEVDLSDEMMNELFHSVDRMSSNTEMSNVLRAAIKKGKITDKQNEAFFLAVGGMSSNTSISSVLRTMIDYGGLSNNTIILLLKETSTLTSNTEMGNVLRDVTVFMNNTPEINDEYFHAVRRMSSNTETSSVLRTLLNTKKLNDASLIPLFQTAERMDSNTELSSVIRTAIETYKLSDKAILAILETIESLSSNTEKGRCLRKLVEDIPRDNSQVMRAFRSTTGTLTSDSEYRRVMDELEN